MPISNENNKGWVDNENLRRCRKNTEMMLKEHLPFPKLNTAEKENTNA